MKAERPEDAIYVTDFNKIFVYSISSSGIVNEKEVHYTYPPAGDSRPLITLFRCEGSIGTTKHALVQGTLQDSYPIEKADLDLLKAMGLITGIKDETITTQNPIVLKNDISGLEKICVFLYRIVSPHQTIYIAIYSIVLTLFVGSTIYVAKRKATNYEVIKGGK